LVRLFLPKELEMKRRSLKSLVPAEIQTFENRVLLAGSATATFSAGLLQVHIAGGGKVRIAETGPGTYRVAPIGIVQINGAVEPLLISGVVNVDVTMDPSTNYDTKNVLRIGFEAGLFTTIPGNVTVDAGGGYNRVYFENAHIGGNVAVERGADNYVDLEQTTVSGTTNVNIPLD
jgi:hypothetical protein